MGIKTRRSTIGVFGDYAVWFQKTYYAEHGPYQDLTPLSKEQLAKLEDEVGVLPQGYRDLVRHFGVGTLLIADEEEPVEFTILSPKQIPKARTDCLSCIDQDLLRLAKERQGIDGSKLLPILVDRDWNQWVLLANQSGRDNRVVLFSHEQEQRDDTDLFKHRGSIEAYFGELFASAKKLYSPWYLWTGWKH